jgi:hypothetical protein
MKRLLLLCLLTASAFAADAPLLQDDFTAPKLESRRAMRGEWKFADHTATCAQDDELFKKNKDHGPILFYDLAHTDATLSMAFKPDAAVKSVVFTCNGADGHVFRIVLSAAGTSVRAFPADSPDHKSIALATEKAVKLVPGQWTPLSVTLNGSKATLKLGDFAQTYDHPSFARPKTNFSLGFSFGTLSVKEVAAVK